MNLLLLLFGAVLVLLERECLKRLQYFTVAYERALFLISFEARCTLQLFEQFQGWPIEPAESSLAFLDLDKLFEVPSELFGDIVVICHISHIDKVIV